MLLFLIAVFGNWPTLQEIEQTIGINSSDSSLTNVSESALLVPSYSNFTGTKYVISKYHHVR